MPRIAVLNVQLSPVLDYDNEAGQYIIYYKEFPYAIATGKSEAEAETNLSFLVEDIWMKRQDESKEYLLTHYKDHISIKPSIEC
jgi:predicted RNase H-like HicB family nuclease